MLGYVDNLDTVYLNNVYNRDLDIYHSSNTTLEKGIHWIYSVLDSVFLYEAKIVYQKNPIFLTDESVSLEKIAYEVGVWELNSNVLNWSVVLDKKQNIEVYENPYLNAWFSYFVNGSESSFLGYIHPELCFINDSITNTLILPFTSSLYFVLTNDYFSECYVSPMFIVMNIILNTSAVLLLISFYFSYYTNSTKDENTIDQDYLVAAMSVEAEEEIASIDDLSLSLFLLIYLFAWFFYANVIFILTNVPEVSMIFYHLPFLYYMTVLIPTLLLYDFGIYFATYLRGASTTPSFVMELLYDYIAFSAFYIRLLVQNVRILLMTFTYFSLYECILTYVSFSSWFGNYETLWEDNDYNYSNYNSYYFLIRIPTQIIYWLYELFHTFFVVTAQFVAFFAMSFWLFLFLFTMFVLEQQERFFNVKKSERKEKLKKILNL